MPNCKSVCNCELSLRRLIHQVDQQHAMNIKHVRDQLIEIRNQMQDLSFADSGISQRDIERLANEINELIG